MKGGITRYPGGKTAIRKWILSLFPDNYQDFYFVDPFCGMCSLLREKKIGCEWINDKNWGVYTLLLTIQNKLPNLIERLTDYSEDTFESAHILLNIVENEGTIITRGTIEFILRQMSRAGLGQDFCWSSRTRRGMPEAVSAYESAIDELPWWEERLKNVKITNLDFREVIPQLNYRHLCYCDPPYLHSTRVSKDLYENEMNKADHEEFLKLCHNSSARILISGYNSDLYNDLLRGWNKHEKQVKNSQSQQKEKPRKTEVIWRNFE